MYSVVVIWHICMYVFFMICIVSCFCFFYSCSFIIVLCLIFYTITSSINAKINCKNCLIELQWKRNKSTRTQSIYARITNYLDVLFYGVFTILLLFAIEIAHRIHSMIIIYKLFFNLSYIYSFFLSEFQHFILYPFNCSISFLCFYSNNLNVRMAIQFIRFCFSLCFYRIDGFFCDWYFNILLLLLFDGILILWLDFAFIWWICSHFCDLLLFVFVCYVVCVALKFLNVYDFVVVVGFFYVS